MFNNIPTVLNSEEIIDKMFRRAKKVEIPYIRDKLSFEKSLSMAKIFTVRDVSVSLLKKYIGSFPYINKLHPFYRSLLDLLIDKNMYKRSLSSLNWAYGKIESLADNYSKKIKGKSKVEEILKLRKEFYGRASSVIKDIKRELKYLNEARNIMRKLPDVDVSIPTIVVAGYPNVGKSEIVKRISSAKPEIASYPFTTKGIIVGHLEIGERRIQIIDTPGLLDRPIEKRNKIEKQAILALKYLANIIIFVLDPSETCGYEIKKQENLLKEIREKFRIKIIVVENKCDLKRREGVNLKISAKTGENIDKLIDLILREVKK